MELYTISKQAGEKFQKELEHYIIEDSIPEFLRAERINMRSDEELYHFLYTFLKEKESISHAKP